MLKKKSLLLLYLFIVSIFLSAEDSQIKLKVGVLKLFPPQYSLSDSGEPVGFAIDVIESISRKSGFVIDYVIKETWADLLIALESGEIDLIPNSGITDERKELFSFSNPVETFVIRIFTRTSYEKFTGIESLNGKKVAVVSVNIGKILLKNTDNVEISTFGHFEHALFALLSGNCDALIAPEPLILNMSRQIRVDNRIEKNGPALTEIKRAITVLKGKEWILEQLNPVINKFLLSEEYQKIYTKWYVKPTPFWSINKVIILMSMLIVIIIFILLVWKYYSTELKVKNRTRELLFRGNLLKNVSEGIITIDLNRKISSCNSGAEILFGIKEKDVLSTPFDLLCCEPNILLDLIKNESDNLKYLKSDLKYFNAKGFIFDGLTSITELLDENNELIGYIFIIQDISDRKKYERALFNEKEQLSVTLSSIADGVITTDVDGKIVMLNKIAEDLTGWNSTDAIGLPLLDVFKIMEGESNELYANPVKEIIEKGDILEFQNHSYLISKNGVKINISDRGAPIKDKKNNIVGFVIIFSDISEKIALQEQALQHRKMESLGQLAGGIAHDFNNVFNGILSATQLLLLNKHNLHVCDLKYINIISDATERAAKLTSKLLAFSHVESAKTTTVDLDEILDDIVDILYNTLQKNITITLSKNAKKRFVSCNKSGLENVLLNMGINSSHAMETGGDLNLITENVTLDQLYCESSGFNLSPGEYCKIIISDTGYGIEQKNINKIFEPFYTNKEQGKGTGLGLSSVYGFVQDHHGEISVSSSVGIGTTFSLLLPLSEETVIEDSEDIVLKGLGTVLLVDDEEINRFLGKEILESLGYNVLLSENGEESVSIYEKSSSQIDIVIMDMIMPKMNGSEAFKKIKKIDDKCKVIIASGYIKDESIDELFHLGLSGYIGKPYRISELSKLLNDILNE